MTSRPLVFAHRLRSYLDSFLWGNALEGITGPFHVRSGACRYYRGACVLTPFQIPMPLYTGGSQPRRPFPSAPFQVPTLMNNKETLLSLVGVVPSSLSC